MSSPPAIGLDARKAGDFGIGTYTRELVAGLAANRDASAFRFVLFTRSGDVGLFGGLPGNFEIVSDDSPGYSLRELTAFPRRVRRRDLDLFHALHYVLPPFLATPSVVTVHDLIHLHPDLGPKRWAAPYARAMLRSALSRARAVIAVSESTRRDIESRFPFAAGKIEVIAEGVSQDFRPDADTAGARKKYGLPDRYAFYLGGRRPHKNLRRVLEAFAIAARSPRLGMPLVLAGPLPDPRPLAAMIPPGLDGLRILGVVPAPDLPALYAGATMFLSPTLAEGFGLPALEAMACGAPVVTSDIPVAHETCADAAWFVDPANSRAIADAILRLADSPEDRARLREKGIRRAAELSWEKTAAKTLAVYAKVLG